MLGGVPAGRGVFPNLWIIRGRGTEDRGWRMEDGGWRMEDGGWRTEVRRHQKKSKNLNPPCILCEEDLYVKK